MKKNLYLMYAIALLQGMVFYGPVATLYRQAQGISIFQITLIESISLALCIAFEIPWGFVADKIGYRKTMIFCCGLYFISKIVFWQATTFGGFLLERIMLSVVLAGFSGVDSSIIYLSCKGKDSQKAFGIYNSMGMAGLLAAAAVFSIAVKDNYPLAGFLTVISYGISAVLSFLLTEVKATKADPQKQESFASLLKKVLSDRCLFLFLVAVALLSETHQTITVFLNQLQYSRCGLENTMIGFLYIVATLLGLCGVYSSAVTKKMGMCFSLMLFCGLTVISCMILAFSQSAVPSVLGILVLRISNSLFQPFQAEIQNKQIKTENRATALSINAMFVDCIAIGTNLIFGALSEWNLSLAFMFGGGICCLSLVCFLIWYRSIPNLSDEKQYIN